MSFAFHKYSKCIVGAFVLAFLFFMLSVLIGIGGEWTEVFYMGGAIIALAGIFCLVKMKKYTAKKEDEKKEDS